MQPRGDNCDDLLKELLQYLPGTNFSLQDFVSVDEEEILDFLDDYGAKMKPKQNIREIMIDLAHNQIISHIADNMRPYNNGTRSAYG